MGILRRGTGSLFSEIPEEVANKIVSDTRDTKYLKDKEASDIFKQEYKNQPPKNEQEITHYVKYFLGD
ncbi:hypothetical protein PGH45_00050 [Legionella pneumophila]|nr:hypothetical protein [Legionella pneumophila]